MTTIKKLFSVWRSVAALTVAVSLCHMVDAAEPTPGLVRCANLIYADGKTSVCFADHFLSDIRKETNIWTDQKFTAVKLDDPQLYEFPFSVMTGEGSFSLTDEQRRNLRDYLAGGGFLVASPGCSSAPWAESFLRELALVFPDVTLTAIPADHAVFRTVYDIKELRTKKKDKHAAVLMGLVIDGRVALVYSPDGLNDTGNAGGKCCCCGGNEVLNARQMNVNLLAYAVTH